MQLSSTRPVKYLSVALTGETVTTMNKNGAQAIAQGAIACIMK